MIISENSSTKVGMSILAPTSSSVIASVASSRMTPRRAMPVRSTCSQGSRPAAMPT
jgi:hypothetical protein